MARLPQRNPTGNTHTAKPRKARLGPFVNRAPDSNLLRCVRNSSRSCKTSIYAQLFSSILRGQSSSLQSVDPFLHLYHSFHDSLVSTIHFTIMKLYQLATMATAVLALPFEESLEARKPGTTCTSPKVRKNWKVATAA